MGKTEVGPITHSLHVFGNHSTQTLLQHNNGTYLAFGLQFASGCSNQRQKEASLACSDNRRGGRIRFRRSAMTLACSVFDPNEKNNCQRQPTTHDIITIKTIAIKMIMGLLVGSLLQNLCMYDQMLGEMVEIEVVVPRN
jgi:hypothetical protein